TSHLYLISTISCCILLYTILVLFPFPFFFFTATATTEIYTLSLHDALPISSLEIVEALSEEVGVFSSVAMLDGAVVLYQLRFLIDRKSTRLNSSHRTISYAVFCLKKKKKKKKKT